MNSRYHYGTTAGNGCCLSLQYISTLLRFLMCCHCKPSLFRCLQQAHKHSVHIQTSEALKTLSNKKNSEIFANSSKPSQALTTFYQTRKGMFAVLNYFAMYLNLKIITKSQKKHFILSAYTTTCQNYCPLK